MSHDVYICYDEEDRVASDAICHVLEENKIKCWIKSRDFLPSDSVENISQAIKNSRCVVLVYSKHSKMSHIVVTEIDIAFANNVSIIVFNIDNSNKKGELEFFLKNKHWLSAFPNPTEQFESLIKDTSNFLGQPIENPKVTPNDTDVFDRIKPPGKNEKLLKYLKIGIPIIIILILVYLFVIHPMGQHTTDDGKFTMNMTKVEVNEINGKYIYTVFGESYNMPDDSIRYIMKTSFLDKNNKEVSTLNATANEFSKGIIGYAEVDEKNITNITFKLVDLNNNVICENYYEMS